MLSIEMKLAQFHAHFSKFHGHLPSLSLRPPSSHLLIQFSANRSLNLLTFAGFSTVFHLSLFLSPSFTLFIQKITLRFFFQPIHWNLSANIFSNSRLGNQLITCKVVLIPAHLIVLFFEKNFQSEPKYSGRICADHIFCSTLLRMLFRPNNRNRIANSIDAQSATHTHTHFYVTRFGNESVWEEKLLHFDGWPCFLSFVVALFIFRLHSFVAHTRFDLVQNQVSLFAKQNDQKWPFVSIQGHFQNRSPTDVHNRATPAHKRL